MKNVLQNPKNILVAALLVIVVTAASWQRDDTIKKDSSTGYNDNRDTTVPGQFNNGKDEFTMKDLDKALSQIDKEMKKLNEQLKNMHVELSETLEKALSAVDIEKINREIKNNLKNIDIENINEEVNRSLREAQLQINKIDKQNINVELEKLQKQINSGELKRQIEESMDNAKLQMEMAKKELQEFKNFVNELQKDGLIDEKKGYSIEWKNGGELYINGTKQPKEVSEKYKKFYKGNNYKFKVNKDHGEYI